MDPQTQDAQDIAVKAPQLPDEPSREDLIAALPARPVRRPALFQASLGVSLAVHLLLFGWLERKRAAAPPVEAKPEVIDVDIRTPFRPREPGVIRPESLPEI